MEMETHKMLRSLQNWNAKANFSKNELKVENRGVYFQMNRLKLCVFRLSDSQGILMT